MIKTTAILALALTLAACSANTRTYQVATGVDANGAVIWETQTVRITPTIMDTPTASLSDGPCWNRECR